MTALKKKRIKNISIIVVLAALIVLGLVCLKNMKNIFIHFETKELESLNVVYNNIFIRGRDIGGLTVEQAVDNLNKSINEGYVKAEDKTVTVRTTTDYEKVFTYEQLGMRFDVESAVAEAYAIGRSGKDSTKRATIADLDVGGKYLDAEYKYDMEQVKECLREIEPEVNESLSDLGVTLDIDKTANSIEENALRVNEYGAVINVWTK